MSNSEQSPDTPAWRAVHAAYARPNANPAATWALIVAATPEYPIGLVQPGVMLALDRLLAAPPRSDDPFSKEALDELLRLKERATRSALEMSGVISFWWYLAEIALHRAILRGALAKTGPVRAQLFLCEILVAAAEYLVGRDQTFLLPKGKGLLDAVALAAERRKAIVEIAVSRVEAVAFSQEPLADWAEAVQAAWSAQ